MSPYLGFYGMDRISGFVEVVSENLKSANWTYILWDGLKLRSFDNGITIEQPLMFCGTVCSLRSSEFASFLSDDLCFVGRIQVEVV